MWSKLRYLRAFWGVALTALLGVLLFITIYFTLFDLQWIAFLAGVLFSSIAVMASKAARLQWLVARRSGQLRRARDRLAEEIARRERGGETQKAAEARLQFMGDALPVMILFVARDEHCLYHNRAFAHWRRQGAERINGHLLCDILSDDIYQDLESHSAEVLAGREIHCEAEWPNADGVRQRYDISLLPYPPGTERPSGFYALIAEIAGGRAPAAQIGSITESVGDAVSGAYESGGRLYLHSLTEQLISGKDPRAQLVLALKEDHFILYAQKIQPLAPDAPFPACLEILLRLQEEEQNMALPGGFFPVAEHYNLMGEIDRWVVRNLLKCCAENRVAHHDWRMPLFCVNLSSTSLCDPAFPPYVQSELEHRKFPAASLCFELAQLDVIDHHDAAQALMSALRPHGCRFTLDAFGAAKVSFAVLKDLTFDLIKIDGVIIQNILKDRADLARTRAITIASHKIGIRTIAEYVETDDVLAKLQEIGVDYVQGFGIGKPGPLTQLLNP